MVVNSETAHEALMRLWQTVPMGSGLDLNLVQTYLEKLESDVDSTYE